MSPKALDLMARAVNGKPCPMAIEAAKTLLAYAWGKPTLLAEIDIHHSYEKLITLSMQDGTDPEPARIADTAEDEDPYQGE